MCAIQARRGGALLRRPSFWRGGRAVFLYIGGEGRRARVADALHAHAGAARTVLMLALELFYGESWPTPDMSNANLQYLSSEQALADLAASPSRPSPTAARRRLRPAAADPGADGSSPWSPSALMPGDAGVAPAQVSGGGRRRRRLVGPCTPRPTSPSTWASSAPRCGRRRSAAPACYGAVRDGADAVAAAVRELLPNAKEPSEAWRDAARGAAAVQPPLSGSTSRRARRGRRLADGGAVQRGGRRRTCATCRAITNARAARRSASPPPRSSTRRGCIPSREKNMAAPLRRPVLAARLQPHVRLRQTVDMANVQRVWLLPDGGRQRPALLRLRRPHRGHRRRRRLRGSVRASEGHEAGYGVGEHQLRRPRPAGAERDGAQRLARPVARARPRQLFGRLLRRVHQAPRRGAAGVRAAGRRRRGARLRMTPLPRHVSPNATPRSASATRRRSRGPEDRRRRGRSTSARRRRGGVTAGVYRVCATCYGVISYNYRITENGALSARDVALPPPHPPPPRPRPPPVAPLPLRAARRSWRSPHGSPRSRACRSGHWRA